MSRPWSPAEVEQKIPELIERIEETITGLRDLAISSTHAEWKYKKARAQALVKVTGKNAEEREAKALLHQLEPGVMVADLGVEADLADKAYRNQRTIASLLETEAKLFQTLHVSARAIDQQGSRR